MYPICTFEHFDVTYTAGVKVDAADPMVAVRPDLFTPDPPESDNPKEA